MLGKSIYWVLGLECFLAGLAKWGAIGIGPFFFTLATVDCWTQESEEHEMGLKKLVSVLISKLFKLVQILIF